GLCSVPLLALSGMLVGLLAGEMWGLFTAVCAALLLGLSQAPGYLGISLFSFSLAAWAAGALGHRFRFRSVLLTSAILLLLVTGERIIWGLLRWALFRDPPGAIGIAHVIGLLIGAWAGGLCTSFLSPRMRRKMFDSDL